MPYWLLGLNYGFLGKLFATALLVSGVGLGTYIGTSKLIVFYENQAYKKSIKTKQKEKYEKIDQKTDKSIGDGLRFE